MNFSSSILNQLLYEFFDWKQKSLDKLSRKGVYVKGKILNLYWEKEYSSKVDETLINNIFG